MADDHHGHGGGGRPEQHGGGGRGGDGRWQGGGGRGAPGPEAWRGGEDRGGPRGYRAPEERGGGRYEQRYDPRSEPRYESRGYAPPSSAYGARRGGYLAAPPGGAVVQDYGRFRLRAPPRGYEWVRTGSGYALVSTMTGQVFDVVPY
jgi:Ni/Co efflux regulator RcnB